MHSDAHILYRGFALIFTRYGYYILYCRTQRIHLPIISAPPTRDPRRRRRRHQVLWLNFSMVYRGRSNYVAHVMAYAGPEPETMCSWACARRSITYVHQRFSLVDAICLFMCLESIHKIRWT